VVGRAHPDQEAPARMRTQHRPRGCGQLGRPNLIRQCLNGPSRWLLRCRLQMRKVLTSWKYHPYVASRTSG
jgi:hypothetical protein